MARISLLLFFLVLAGLQGYVWTEVLGNTTLALLLSLGGGMLLGHLAARIERRLGWR